jgi:hypothetical protein
MNCARCGRVIKSTNYQRIGNYVYGSTCMKQMIKKNLIIKNKVIKPESDIQIELFT